MRAGRTASEHSRRRHSALRLDVKKKMSEENRRRRVPPEEKVTKVVHDDLPVVINLHEPVSVVEVMSEDVVEGLHRLRRQVFATGQIGCNHVHRKISARVVLFADEEQLIETPDPSR